MSVFNVEMTHIFWNADSWLPDKYEDPYNINYSLTESLVKKHLRGHYVTAYGDEDKFTGELVERYHDSAGFSGFQTTKGSADERLYMMLLNIMVRADKYRQSDLVIITKLSQDSEMICRVLGSLRRRGYRVLFTLPELDVEEAQSKFGITVRSEQTNSNERIPVWLCPKLFEYERPHQPELDDGDSMRYFIEPPPPAAHTLDFSMPVDVDTCIFWDVKDYPPPTDIPPSQFYRKIRSTVRAGCGRRPSCGLSIYTYVVKGETFAYPDDAGITVTVVPDAPADKFARLGKMTLDFLLWSMDNPATRHGPQSRPNLLVISKLLQPDIFKVRYTLRNLKSKGYNVFLVVPREEIPQAYDAKFNLPLLSWEDLSATAKRKVRG